MARNAGRTAEHGGITVSFPGVERDGEGARVIALIAGFTDGSLPEDRFAKNRGENVWVNGVPQPADYLVHEVRVRGWGTNVALELGLNVLALRPGVLEFLVRTWGCDRDWSGCVHYPADVLNCDQQSFGVFAFAINVRAST